MDLPSPTDAATVSSGLEASDITAIAGVIVAVCALFITIWQAWASRQHAVTSVRPVLISQSQNDYTNGIHTVSWFIENLGLGPARIKSFVYIINHKKIRPEEAERSINQTQYILHKLSISTEHKVLHAQALKEGSMIIPGSHTCLYKIVTLPDKHDDLIDKLIQIDAHIVYEDLYGNVQPPLVIQTKSNKK